jgi:hypothetical protein
MKLSNLRNPLPNIRKAYSSNFSNATNESSDEKGAAELNEWIMPLLRLLVKGAGMVGRGARGVGKVVGPAAVPGGPDVVGNPFDPFGGEFDSNAGGDNTGSPFDSTGGDPRWMWDPEDPDYNPNPWGDGDVGDGIERDLDFGPDQAVPPTSTPAPPPPAGPRGVGRGMNP